MYMEISENKKINIFGKNGFNRYDGGKGQEIVLTRKLDTELNRYEPSTLSLREPISMET